MFGQSAPSEQMFSNVDASRRSVPGVALRPGEIVSGTVRDGQGRCPGVVFLRQFKEYNKKLFVSKTVSQLVDDSVHFRLYTDMSLFKVNSVKNLHRNVTMIIYCNSYMKLTMQ